MCKEKAKGVCQIIPPIILENVAANGTAQQKELAFQSLDISSQIRGQRQVLTNFAVFASLSVGTKRRTIFDAKNLNSLPGTLVRSEGSGASSDVSVNEAYNGSGKTYDFYKKIFDRNSIDNNGMRLDSTVHYARSYNNAFWNGQQMVYGDGDGQIFNRFTLSIDVIGHELTHGITEFESGLIYQGQSGALNEHLSDVFGSLIKQYSKTPKQKASAADWLIGEGLFTANINGVALRSMKAPGTAYNDPLIGKDPQPNHMSKYVNTSSDNGGVHINSGIPNKAFCDFAISLGGYAWDKAGKIWYVTLCEKAQENTNFIEFRDMTVEVSKTLYGATSNETNKLIAAWGGVGL